MGYGDRGFHTALHAKVFEAAISWCSLSPHCSLVNHQAASRHGVTSMRGVGHEKISQLDKTNVGLDGCFLLPRKNLYLFLSLFTIPYRLHEALLKT